MTKFDTETMRNIEEILTKFDKDLYLSKIDLSKGFWQIPVEGQCRHMKAFTTSTGAYQFKKTPFGLVNSPATFNKMMGEMRLDAKYTEHYVDDIMAHTLTWEGHMTALRDFFRVSKPILTIRPSKCMIGFQKIDFARHLLRNCKLEMEGDKIDKINNASQPKPKKQVISFLGPKGFINFLVSHVSMLFYYFSVACFY